MCKYVLYLERVKEGKEVKCVTGETCLRMFWNQACLYKKYESIEMDSKCFQKYGSSIFKEQDFEQDKCLCFRV